MRIIITAIIIYFLSLSSFWILGFTMAKADTKTETIVGHVITQAIQGNDMDHAEVMSNEIAALMHKFTIEMTGVLLQNMPNILDSISAQLRQELDKQYKCSLQGEYKNKECI
jgi:hypothetical protein|tara:strand:- start:1667 stop:2002 length:336 start_codon:yes stop_codon:yes gene_type:complete